MSFQHFRLHPQTQQAQPTVLSQSQSSLSQALGHQPPIPPPQPQLTQAALVLNNGTASGVLQIQHVGDGSLKKGPYGSGELDDGYTMTFATMEEFNEWRKQEEEEKVVEFVKGDTHGSKAVPPRFKEHTKLVCARHTRSGRKKYVKKFPDRVRKVPSRKIEGQGCPASISYKTYFDTDEVRVSYMSEHSHEIGLANLPYTKRGRRAQVLPDSMHQNGQSSDGRESTEDPESPSPIPAQSLSTAGPSSPIMQHQQAAPSLSHLTPPQTFQTVMALYSNPPQQAQLQHQPQQHPSPASHPPSTTHIALQERWDRMAVLFQGVRDHARTFEYPSPSVAALESILIRLYLESPVNISNDAPMNDG
ncbi:hypothetical protein BDW22DRAFT_1479629 [Trametopsis cervina]|nr:hypothetical protein BDW22DRAFT_1479629 [Trametopsis cervina]